LRADARYVGASANDGCGTADAAPAGNRAPPARGLAHDALEGDVVPEADWGAPEDELEQPAAQALSIKTATVDVERGTPSRMPRGRRRSTTTTLRLVIPIVTAMNRVVP
jgi:hypothetical protein